MTRQLILAYGKETEHQRAIFAVLSFWAWYEGDRSAVQTVIFTDRPELFTPHLVGLPVEYRLLTPESLTQMRGAQNYVHRIKLGIITQIAEEYPTDALFFCDSDTFFVVPAAPLLGLLRPGFSVMHVREQSYTEAVATWASFTPAQDEYPRKFVDLIESREFELLPGTSHRFYPTQSMWNSGVLGLHPEVLPLVPHIVTLNDAFYKESEWVVSEQVAFSLALQVYTEIVPSIQYVFHYWSKRQKAVVDELLADLPALLPPTQPLDKRLAQVRALTASWRQAVNKDEAQQAAKLAFSRGEVLNGVKFTAKALLSKVLP